MVRLPVRADHLARRRVAALAAPAGDRGSVRGGTVWLERRIRSAGLPVDAAGAAAVVPWVVVGGPLLALLIGGPVVAVGAVVVAGAGALVVVRTAPGRRAAADERDLPEVLERVARHLRSGGNLTQAVIAAAPGVAESGGGDLAGDWAELVALLPSVGVVAAFDRWAAAPTTRPSARLAAAAMAMAAETGGSPARAVDGVASTLRSRAAVGEEIRALSSQARASAAVIALAPLGFSLLASATDDRTAAFFTSPVGVAVAAVGLALDGLGAWWMTRLCRPPAALGVRP